jgi:hypothetical protein
MGKTGSDFANGFKSVTESGCLYVFIWLIDEYLNAIQLERYSIVRIVNKLIWNTKMYIYI